MITKILGFISSANSGVRVFDAVKSVAGALAQADFVDLFHDENTPEIQSVLKELDRLGLFPWGYRLLNAGQSPPRVYLKRIREYDHSDLSGCEFVQLTPKKRIADSEMRPPYDDVLSAYAQSFPRGLKIASSFLDAVRLLIPHETREVIDREGFSGVAYREVRLVKKRNSDDRWTHDVVTVPWEKRAPWWELTSSVTMPAVAPGLVVYHEKQLLPRGCTTLPSLFRDVDYDDAELRFYAGEVRAISPFDFAMTLERSRGELARYYICSQRMYQFGVAQGWECRWRPVRLIPRP